MWNRSILTLAVAIAWFTTGLLWAEKPSPAAGLHASTVDDFEDGDRRARPGLSWISIADDLAGGSSVAELQVTAAGARSQHALQLAGTVAPGGFAGAWVALDGRAQPVDVSDFEGIRLRIRGDGALQLGLRAGPLPGVNYMAPIEARKDWTRITVPLATLRAANSGAPPIDLRNARWLGISTPSGRAGRFEFEIDDVELYTSRADARLRVRSAPALAVRFQPAPPSEVPAGPWREIARDPSGDGKQGKLPDATSLAVCFDNAHDRVWFRIALAGPPPKRWLGANLALDLDGDPGNGMAWWGTNTAFHFDRLVTVYGFETGTGYEGQIGIADAAEVQAGRLNESRRGPVRVVLDSANPAFVIGIPRGVLGTEPKAPIRLLAAVGSSFSHNDDVPDEGAALLGR